MMVILGVCSRSDSARAEETTRNAMRTKLQYASGALEGLTLSRFELVATNAVLLRDLSMTNAFSITGNPEYRKRSTNYLRSVDRLITAAREQNLERATVAYGEVTRGCIECHKIFRREQFFKSQTETKKQ